MCFPSKCAYVPTLFGKSHVIFPLLSQAEDHVAAGAFGEVRRLGGKVLGNLEDRYINRYSHPQIDGKVNHH